LVLKLMDSYPIVITGGGALLGWIGGGMITSDPALPANLFDGIPYVKQLLSATGALLVVALGKLLSMPTLKTQHAPLIDLLATKKKED